MDALEQRRFVEAFSFALEAHGSQTRKGIAVPYASHLLQVAGRVLEHGGDLTQAIAGLLHDAIEDTPVSYEQIVERFGHEVAEIVRDCTDTLPGESRGNKRPWRQRKSEHLAHLESAPARSLLVCVCDKSHNLASTLLDLRCQGLDYFERFNAGPDEQLWYVERVLEIARARIPVRLKLELERLVEQLREVVASAR